MMYKLLDFDPVDKNGEPTIRIIPKSSGSNGTVKLASVDGAYAPEIREFIKSLKPVVGKLYALINSMGATEFFGCNRNGDAFYEDALKKYHHTFVEDGHAFMHHKNKDPEKSYGKVVFSAYNDKMHRVELVVEYDTNKLDKKFVDKIENGDMVNVSMGCRVDSDYCSICGHRAKTPAEYCKHLKYEPGLARMLPDGRKAFAINRDPHFFDISIVTIPADPTARVMAKLASDRSEIVSSVTRAEEEFGVNEKTAGATIKSLDLNDDEHAEEECSCEEHDAIGKILDELTSAFDSFMGPDIPSSILDSIGRMSDNPLSLLSGFIKKKIFLRPHEVQRIVLVSSGKKDEADELDKKKCVIMADPEIGLKEFAKCDTNFDGLDALPPVFEESRTLNDDTIKKITIRIVAGDDPSEKTAASRPISVDYSDDFKYLMGNQDIMNAGRSGLLPFLKDSTSAYMVLGSVLSAFNALLGGNLSADFVKGVGLGSLIGGPNLIHSITDNLENINKPVQEMRFMNARTPEVIEQALTDAIAKAQMIQQMPRIPILESSQMIPGMKLGSYKYAFSSAPISSFLPKALISVPLAYGASKLITNSAQEDAMREAQVTGKYEPGILSKSSITFPLALAAIMKFASAKKVADDYIKTAEMKGLSKKQVYPYLYKVLFFKK